MRASHEEVADVVSLSASVTNPLNGLASVILVGLGKLAAGSHVLRGEGHLLDPRHVEDGIEARIAGARLGRELVEPYEIVFDQVPVAANEHNLARCAKRDVEHGRPGASIPR